MKFSDAFSRKKIRSCLLPTLQRCRMAWISLLLRWSAGTAQRIALNYTCRPIDELTDLDRQFLRQLFNLLPPLLNARYFAAQPPTPQCRVRSSIWFGASDAHDR